MPHCTYCPLLCSFEQSHELDACHLRSNAIAQPRTSEFFVGGKLTSPNQAISDAAELIERADHVCFTGSIASVQTARKVLSLAESLNAWVDLSDSQGSFDWLEVLQSDGFMGASFSEIQSRSDLIVVFGDDRLFDAQPRLLDVLAQPSKLPAANRQIVLLGQFSEALITKLTTKLPKNLIVPIVLKDLEFDFEIVAQGKLAMLLNEAKYASLVWSTGIQYDSGSRLHRILVNAIAGRSMKQRIVGVPLSGTSITFQQTATWLTGFPGRLQFQHGIVSYEPRLFTVDKFCEAADYSSGKYLVIQIDEVGQAVQTVRKELGDSQRIEFGLHRNANSNEDVFIPIARPGTEFPATFFRSDASVSLFCTPNKTGSMAEKSPAASWLQKLADEIKR